MGDGLELHGEPAADVMVSRTQDHRLRIALAGGHVALREKILEIGHGVNMDGEEVRRGNRLANLDAQEGLKLKIGLASREWTGVRGRWAPTRMRWRRACEYAGHPR